MEVCVFMLLYKMIYRRKYYSYTYYLILGILLIVQVDQKLK